MPGSRNSKVIDPRTRGEMPPPEVVPFWHVKLHMGANEAASNEEQAPKQNKSNQDKTKEDKIKKTLRECDRISAFLSFTAFVIGLIVAGLKHVLDTKLPLFKQELIFMNKTYAPFVAYEQYSAVVQNETCLKNLEPVQTCRNYTRDKNDFKVYHAFPETVLLKNWDIPLFLIISIVLLISCFVQAYRYYNNRVNVASNGGYTALDSKNEAGYNPIKPDFWRWCEYAFTSPFQVLLIGLVMLIQDVYLLFALCGLQFALMWFGFAIEKQIHKLYKKPDKSGMKMWILLFCAWVCFVIIWGILFAQFAMLDKNMKQCVEEDKRGIPGEVKALVSLQFVSFFLFGFVQTCQAIVSKYDWGCFYFCCGCNHASRNTYVDWGYFAFLSNHEQTDKNLKWLSVTLWYSVLSLTSKLFLDVTLLTVVIMNDDIQCTGTLFQAISAT